MHDSALSLFLFPSMPAGDRRLVLDLGELLILTEGRYREHLATELRLLQDVARAEGARASDRPGGRVLAFRRPILRGQS